MGRSNLKYFIANFGDENRGYTALLDDGAMFSVISVEAVRAIQRASPESVICIDPSPSNVSGVGGSERSPFSVTMNLSVQDTHIQHDFSALHQMPTAGIDLLLGMPFYDHYVTLEDRVNSTITLNNGTKLSYVRPYRDPPRPLLSKDEPGWSVSVVGCRKIAPMTSQIVTLRAHGVRGKLPQAILEPVDNTRNWMARRIVQGTTHGNKGSFRALITNMSREAFVLHNTTVGVATRISDDDIFYTERITESVNNVASTPVTTVKHDILPGEVREHLLPYKYVHPPNLSESERRLVEDLLIKHTDLFDHGPDDHRFLNAEPVKLELGHDKPIFIKQYPLSRIQQDAFEAIADDLRKKGIIGYSTSNYNSPCLVVPKKNGTWRLVTDLRAINEALVHKDWPLLSIEECFEAFAGCKYFATWDVKDGYFQIRIDEKSRKYLAFSTPTAKYEYKVLPQGLRTSGAIFCREVAPLLRGIPRVINYIDDGGAGGRTIQELLLTLDKAFAAMRDKGVLLKGAKLSIGGPSISILGHTCDAQGVRIDPDRYAKIQDWPTPSTVKDVRSFLGLCSYVRRFIPEFARRADPLYKLIGGKKKGQQLKKNASVAWKDSHEEAFQDLKTALITDALGYPDYAKDAKPFRVKVDACKEAEGCCLTQMQTIDGELVEVTLAYFSRAFKRHELPWHISEKEAHSMVWAYTTAAHHYVHGRESECWTDHKPNVAMQRKRMHNERLLRWALQLQGYRMVIKYKTGESHVQADAMSRLKYLQDQCTPKEWVTADISAITGQLAPRQFWIHKFPFTCRPSVERHQNTAR